MSSVMYDLAYPLISVFINAFILRQTNSATAVAVYNLASFFSIPLSFWLNGWLIKRFGINRVMGAGVVGMGLVVFLVFVLPFSGLLGLALFGFLYGFPVGFYWANRNFVTLESTTDKNRTYYTGLESIATTLTGVIMPIAIGFAIRFGEYQKVYSAEQAYVLLSVFALVLLVTAAYLFWNVKLKKPAFKKLFVKDADAMWQAARWQEVWVGFNTGLGFFIPTLLTFQLLGKEAALGTLQSLAAIIAMGCMYYVARVLKPDQRLLQIQVSVALLLVLGSWLALSFSPLAAIFYLLFVDFARALIWTSSNPLSQLAIDFQENGSATNNYAYVCDRELFLNVGRVVGVACFFGLKLFVSDAESLRFIPLVIAVSQIGVWFAAQRIMVLALEQKK
jgi:YQGE family putative transporter